jgi:alanyl-tRNA synthetase
VKRQLEQLEEASRRLKVHPLELVDRIERLFAQQRQLERELESFKASLAARRSADLLDRAAEIGGVRVLVTQVEADNPKALREMNDRFKERMGTGVVVLGAAHDGKVFLLAGVTDDLTKRLHAGHLIREIAAVVGGSGGGRPDMAQAGGSRPEKLAEAFDVARRIIQERLEGRG